MNWIERMYEIKGKDLYSQNGEGLLLEYVFSQGISVTRKTYLDIGSGDSFHLSNSRHLYHLGWKGVCLDRETGHNVTRENILSWIKEDLFAFVSIDIDGNDYWILNEIMDNWSIPLVIAEFNPAFTDSRTIKYNPNHEWAGDDYYGFSFEAAKKLAEKHGYEIIFNVANMNLIMVRKDLIAGLTVPPVTYEQVKFFKESNRTDWEWI